MERYITVDVLARGDSKGKMSCVSQNRGIDNGTELRVRMTMLRYYSSWRRPTPQVYRQSLSSLPQFLFQVFNWDRAWKVHATSTRNTRLTTSSTHEGSEYSRLIRRVLSSASGQLLLAQRDSHMRFHQSPQIKRDDKTNSLIKRCYLHRLQNWFWPP